MHVTCNTVQSGRFYHPFENKYTILRLEIVSEMAYEFCYCVDIKVNQILTKYGHLVQLHCGFFEVSKDCALSPLKKIWVLGAVTL